MNDIIQLGGNIELVGFSILDPASLIVLKKIVGNYARTFSNKTPVEKLSLSLNKNDASVFLTAVLATTDKSMTSEVSHKNLFIALDTALKKLERDI